MQLHLDEIATKVALGAHAIILLDQAGWHGAKALVVPNNISLMPLPRLHRRWQGLSLEQCGRARPSRVCTWPKILALRRLRTWRRPGCRHGHVDHDGQAQ